MITIDDIRAFLKVAEHKSFIKAADELFITPPALSPRIKKLEEYVGESLFERTTHMVEITAPGQILLEREIGIASWRSSTASTAVSLFIDHVKKNFVKHFETSTASFYSRHRLTYQLHPVELNSQ